MNKIWNSLRSLFRLLAVGLVIVGIGLIVIGGYYALTYSLSWTIWYSIGSLGWRVGCWLGFGEILLILALPLYVESLPSDSKAK